MDCIKLVRDPKKIGGAQQPWPGRHYMYMYTQSVLFTKQFSPNNK